MTFLLRFTLLHRPEQASLGHPLTIPCLIIHRGCDTAVCPGCGSTTASWNPGLVATHTTVSVPETRVLSVTLAHWLHMVLGAPLTLLNVPHVWATCYHRMVNTQPIYHYTHSHILHHMSELKRLISDPTGMPLPLGKTLLPPSFLSEPANGLLVTFTSDWLAKQHSNF